MDTLTIDRPERGDYLNIERAKVIFWENLGNYFYMQRNGFYKEYISYHISNELENQWSQSLMKELLEKVLNGDVHSIWAITLLRVSKADIENSFEMIASSKVAKESYEHIIKIKRLFDPEILEAIFIIFKKSNSKI
jgi:predicted nucleic acid-binding protein